jgi:hypothetical protein
MPEMLREQVLGQGGVPAATTESDDAAVRSEPARGREIVFELHLPPVELLRIAKSFDFFASVRVENEQLQAIAVGARAGFASNELTAAFEKKDHG